MKRILCDKCKKEIKFLNVNRYISFGIYNNNNSIELCKKCNKKLKEWLK